MTARTTPPFRGDPVGSFLRAKFLLAVRAQEARGEITAEPLRAVEGKAITETVKLRQDVGLQRITDGELRRTCFHIDFLEQLAPSPQCGFSSTVEGNNIAVQAQRAKLRRVVETDAEVWP